MFVQQLSGSLAVFQDMRHSKGRRQRDIVRQRLGQITQHGFAHGEQIVVVRPRTQKARQDLANRFADTVQTLAHVIGQVRLGLRDQPVQALEHLLQAQAVFDVTLKFGRLATQEPAGGIQAGRDGHPAVVDDAGKQQDRTQQRERAARDVRGAVEEQQCPQLQRTLSHEVSIGFSASLVAANFLEDLPQLQVASVEFPPA